MLTVIATTCVAAACGGTKSSVCLHHSYNKGTPTSRSLPGLPGARHDAAWAGQGAGLRGDEGRAIVQISPELGQKHFLSDPRGQEVTERQGNLSGVSRESG